MLRLSKLSVKTKSDREKKIREKRKRKTVHDYRFKHENIAWISNFIYCKKISFDREMLMFPNVKCSLLHFSSFIITPTYTVVFSLVEREFLQNL